jgi:hypothetical protein
VLAHERLAGREDMRARGERSRDDLCLSPQVVPLSGFRASHGYLLNSS